MRYNDMNWALVVPLANEEKEFDAFISELAIELDELRSGKVYLIVDQVSKDNTLELCKALSAKDPRFETVWAPENKNVAQAYLKGYAKALQNGHDFILEMDAGLSHDPKTIPLFLNALRGGYECAFGSRFVAGGAMKESAAKRLFLSKGGTILANLLLGSRMKDMTSGFQGFRAGIVKQFLAYRFLSTRHFYQTELRYLLRKKHFTEIPIQYRAPSPSVSMMSVSNSIWVLLHYFVLRITFQSPAL